jgi:flagellin
VTSILTNAGATFTVDQLRAITSARTDRQQEIATGLRVQTAADNSAYWSIATMMRSDNRALAAAEDGLGIGAAAVDTAYTGMTAAIDVVEEIKRKLVTAHEAGTNFPKLDSEITELKSELRTIAEGASFNGENWLLRRSAADDAARQIVGSFGRDSQGNVSVQTMIYSMWNGNGTNHLIDEDSTAGILTNAAYAADVGATTDWVLINGRNQTLHTEIKLDASTTRAQVSEMLSVTDRMLVAMTDASADLGSLVSRIEMQQGFVADLQQTLDKGVGRLVDADMNSAASRLRAVDVQQSLANGALSIANAAPRNLLSLLG